MKQALLTLIFCLFLLSNALAQPGTPDYSFGDGGGIKTYNASHGWISDIKMLPGDSMVVAGCFDAYFVIFKCDKNGLVDANFGRPTQDYYSYQGARSFLDVDSKGRIIVVNNERKIMYRYVPDGRKDMNFGTNGKIELSVVGTSECIMTQPDDKILLLTSFGEIIRYNTDGSVDPSLNQPLRVSARTMILQPDGKIVTMINHSGNSIDIARLNNDGSKDQNFGSSVTLSSPYTEVVASQLQPDGKIIMAGNTNERAFAMRFNADGTLDNAFAVNGIFSPVVSDTFERIFDIQLQPDGKILLAGQSENIKQMGEKKMLIYRLSKDGHPDPFFANRGRITYVDQHSCAINTAALQSDGRILIGGYFEDASYFRDAVIMRLHSDVSASATNIEEDKTITLYPNPAQDHITLQLPSDDKHNYRILNLYGQAIQHGETASGDNIAIAELPTGIYMLSLQLGGQTVIKKFVKE